MRFCLGKCRAAAYAISGRPLGRPGNEVERALDDLVDWLNLIRIDDFVEAGPARGADQRHRPHPRASARPSIAPTSTSRASLNPAELAGSDLRQAAVPRAPSATRQTASARRAPADGW